MTFSLDESLKHAYKAEVQKNIEDRRIPRIWEKDATVWTNRGESEWLGWLNIVDEELTKLDEYKDFHETVIQGEFADIVLLGMGGSSLCPEVLSLTFEKPNFHVLDSTVPAQIISLEAKIDMARTLFIVASKSGSTLEPHCFQQYFFEKVSKAVGSENAGKHFVAITDPGSKLEKLALDRNYRKIFHGKPDIGGRFSALSAFGLAPAAAMGLDVHRMLNSAATMVRSCKATNQSENPGAILGTILAVCQKNKRDKLTIFTPIEFYDLGAWLEQLVAESTGKNGVSIIPVDREQMQPADLYGNDRIFINYTLKGLTVDEDSLADLADIKEAGHPIVNIEIENLYSIGQEFFRWEFATAVVGSLMGINPFDQPDVEAAKVEARKITDEYEATGSLPTQNYFFTEDGVSLFATDEYAAELAETADAKSLAGFLESHLWNLAENDYFAILAYIEMDEQHEDILQQIRTHVLQEYTVATCVGFGPRFLHSTGQAYKGGADSGVFLQITADDPIDIPIPDQKFTFGVVKNAQARGDFRVLLDRGRRAMGVHIHGDLEEGLKKVFDAIS